MAITISGQNNNDKILASDGVLDQISGFNVVGVLTASTFETTGEITANHIDVGSSIQLGNAGIITATTLIGNVTGLLFIKYLRKIKKSNDLMLIGLLILTIIILKYNTALSFHNGLLMVVFVPLILLISCSKGLIYKFFNKKSLVYLGNISFGIYIFLLLHLLFELGLLSR